MAELTGSEILAKSLKNEGTDIPFFLMGGPMLLAESSCIKEGIRPLDVRHEQSAAFMGQAYSRLLQKPSVCMAASGPGVINLTTGIANALIDCCPVVAVGGSSSGRCLSQATNTPMRRARSVCWAPTASGYMTAVLPMSVITSRHLK
jgi:thiamine pyrophosphate-dependent acetolactate synthase large subunit-like protein